MGRKRCCVSIIMAAYNAERTIETAINSVLKQTYTDWELLIVDDCSQDRTVFIVNSFLKQDSRIYLLKNEANSGVSVSRKRGMEAAHGEWIAVLDSDDAWTLDKLEKQLALAEKTNGSLIFTGSAFMNQDGQMRDWQLHVPDKLTYRQLLKQNLISNSSVLVKKDLYQKHYAVGDQMHEDFAIWLRITKDGYTAYGIDEPLLIYRLSHTSKSANKLKAAKMNWNTYRYVGLHPVSAFYYECWYAIRGLCKYKNLTK